MTLNPHSIFPIIVLTLAACIGIFVLKQNIRSEINRYFFVICITISLWLSFYIPYNLNVDEETYITWCRISHCGTVFIGIACFAYTASFLNAKHLKKWIPLNFFIGSIFLIVNLTTPLIIQGARHFSWGLYPKAGLLHPAYLLHLFILISIIIWSLIKAIQLKKTNPNKVNQIKYVLLGFSVFTLATFDFTTNYGINYYPLGPIAALLFLFIISYNIVKHQLMDIKIVLRKGLIYSFLITSITLVYLISVIIFERIFHEIFGYKNIIISILTATVIALVFIPLKNRIQYILDKIFFKGSNIEIAEQNEQLRREIVQSERLKSIAILASGMAHEIKNPLTVLKTFSEFLPRKMDDKEFLKKFQPMIAHEIDRIDALVHELLDFAKPAPLQIKPTPIHPLLDQTLEVLSNDFLKHKINMHKDYSLETQAVLNLDPNQFKQALLNILLNAMEAMPTGGIITVTTRPSADLQYALIKIQDTGCGIRSEDIAHIFDPFFTKKDHGTGLGLSITYEIVRGHQGKIFVESEESRGTAFVIELPL